MHWLRCCFLFGGLGLLLGCGSSGPALPVSGIVTLDGNPLPSAQVTFIPEKDTGGHGGVATTGSDGKFVIANAKGEPGLIAGQYKVTVSKGQLKTPSGEESVGAIIEEIDLKDEFPPIYSSPTQTILSYSVTGDGKPIEIKLDSKRKK
jgi:hypothetical protein